MTADEITRSVEVPAEAQVAWTLFIDRFADWWPREHCLCGEDALDRVFIDIDAGVWGEVTRAGERRAWGTVRDANPGRAITLGWQMDATVSPWVPEPDPERDSLIDVTFAPSPAGTRVTLRHHAFARQGDPQATAMRDVMIGLDRWRDWLDLYRRHVERQSGGTA